MHRSRQRKHRLVTRRRHWRACLVALAWWAGQTAPAVAQPANTSKKGPHELPASGEVVAPVPLSPTDVAYPAGGAGSARVLLELVVEVDGSVSQVGVVEGEPPFAESAARAARSWRFRPARADGTPLRARIRFLVEFAERLQNDPEAAGEVSPPTAPQPSDGEANQAVEIEVRGERQPGAQRVTRAQARQLPGAFGNPFRALEMNPGVTPTLSGAPYFYVRGAPPANLGYFLDDIRLPALFHVIAGPSVVHPGLVESVDFYAAAYPARYGRFSGGIAAGSLREARHELHGEVSIRAYDSSGLLEVPLTGDTSLTLSGRYSYANPVARLFAPEISVLFWDYQARLSHRLSERDELVVFGFGSRDQLDEEEAGVRERIYGAEFHRLDLSYRHRLDSGRFRVRSLLGWDQSTREDGRVELTDTLTRWQADFKSQVAETLEFGAGLDAGQDRYQLDSGGLEDSQARDDFLERFPARTEAVLGAHAALLWQATPAVLLTPGLRSDLYTSSEETALAVEPRIHAEFQVTPRWTLLQGFGIASQPPTDPAPQPANAPKLKDGLQTAVQSSAGVRYRVVDVISVQLGVFQNAFFNLSDGLGISRIDNAEESIDEQSRSTGSARGIELLVQRSFARRLHGYLAYTLAWSRRWVGRAEGPSLFDRRHVLSGAIGYRFDHGFRAGLRGSYYTGIPADVAYLEAARDPPRTSPFARLDVRAEKRWQLAGPGSYWAIVLEVLNATLNTEVLEKSCSAYVCREEEVGPITIPSLGLEAAF